MAVDVTAVAEKLREMADEIEAFGELALASPVERPFQVELWRHDVLLQRSVGVLSGIGGFEIGFDPFLGPVAITRVSITW